MKLKRRLFATVLALAMILSLCACGATSKERTLRGTGLTMIGVMEEMVNSEYYIEFHTTSEDLKAVISTIAEGDYSEPIAIYSITAPDNLSDMWDESPHDLESLSEPLRDAVLQKAFGPATIARINAAGGAETLAATTVCTASETFVCQEATEDIIYLYVFENGCPAAVCFTIGEDHAVSASGTFIVNEQFDGSSQESVAAFFAEYGAEVGTVPLS